jgi:transcriptional accessory protein Tex/SPT6
VESPDQIVSVGEQVRVKVVDVDVGRRRISLSTRRVAEEPEVLPEPEIHAEAAEAIVADLAPEPSEETKAVLADAAARGDEGTDEAFAAYTEPEQEAPEEAAMHVEPAAEGEEEDVSLEQILEDLKRREGRA